MTKFQVVIVLAAIAIASCLAGVPAKRYNSRFIASSRTRVLARQEAVGEADVAAVTPYPSADELKPKIPFDEIQPEVVPAEPEITIPDEIYGPPDVRDNHIPDEVYGPPEVWLPADEPGLSFEKQARIVVTARKIAALRQRKLQALRQLVAAKQSYLRPAKLRVHHGKRYVSVQ